MRDDWRVMDFYRQLASHQTILAELQVMLSVNQACMMRGEAPKYGEEQLSQIQRVVSCCVPHVPNPTT